MTKILRITAKRAGFRRAGIAHPDTPVDHPAGKFTADQVKALKAETMLIVQEIDGKEAKAAPVSTPGTSDNDGGAPTGLARAEAIAEAVRNLDPENPAHFTKDGKPKVPAIVEAAGFDISGDERDAAWATVQAEREAADKDG